MASDESGPKISVPIHPPLVALFFVVGVYAANVDMVPLSNLIVPLLVAASFALCTWAIGALAWRDVRRGAVAASGFIVLFATYSFVVTWMSKNLDWIPVLPLWWCLTLVVTFLLSWKVVWTKFFNVVSVFLLAVAMAQAMLVILKAGHVASSSGATQGWARPATDSRTDIYYIVLDGFGRTDQLARVMGSTDTEFVKGLQSRGFFVAKGSHSNYCQTELSVASSLNFEFIQDLYSTKPTDTSRAPLEQLVNNNRAAHALRELGYKSIAVTTGFPPLGSLGADTEMDNAPGWTLIETALLQMTPLRTSSALGPMFDQRRRLLNRAFEELTSLGPPDLQPKFVIAHILAPHPPFVFGPNGEPERSRHLYGFWDGSDYMTYAGTAEDYRVGYSGQAVYVGKRILEIVDAILRNPGPKPVIILQGDHGSKLHLDQNRIEKTDLNEVFSNLTAVYGPKSVIDRLYPSVTPVNLFRIVFEGLFNAHLPLKPDESFYSPFEKPYEFTDVTQRLGSTSGWAQRIPTDTATARN